MNCVESRLLLHAHLDGELDAAHGTELERHLASCAACSAEHKSVRSLKSALQFSSLRSAAPHSLRREVRRLASGQAVVMKHSLFQSLQLWRALAFGATVVALAAICFRPAGTSDDERLMNEAIASHIRSLMVEHLTDVASSDQHTVKPWFNGKLDFAPVVADFAAQGFPLLGGRLDYLGGRTVAALVYRRNKHFINVFIWPATNAGRVAHAAESVRGYSLVNCEVNGLRYCFVSDLNSEELT
ncbi:MAG TPA: anti-sigma factor, partial [Verrucomicrobiae bacterium]|nr:anti-sigma factor [Verrucomicrobiae bacterium]